MALLRATTPAPVQMPHADATKSTLASGSRMRSSRSSFAAVALRHSTLPERRRRGPRPRRRVVPQQQRRHATRRARVATAILLAQVRDQGGSSRLRGSHALHNRELYPADDLLGHTAPGRGSSSAEISLQLSDLPLSNWSQGQLCFSKRGRKRTKDTSFELGLKTLQSRGRSRGQQASFERTKPWEEPRPRGRWSHQLVETKPLASLARR